jgi:hypothetical protein
MKKFLLLIAVPAVVFSCKSKKVSLAVNDEQVNISDFLEAFPTLGLPYEATDTILRRKEQETAVIDDALFERFVPDSILSRLFGKDGHVRLYAVGKIGVPGAETYVFVKGVAKDRRAMDMLVFDKKNHFAASRPVLYSDNEPGVTGKVDMDNKYTLTLLHQRKAPEGQLYYHRDAYVFAEGTGFSLILTETNESKPRVPTIYNPIDTLPHKHRYSGDYAQDKRNLVCVRDGRDPSRFLFFVHFEKDDGTCKGELKGEAKFVSPGVARYRSYSDPCAIEFTFIPEGVSLKETGGCGVHRDIRCFFEGYFERRKIMHGTPRPHHN